MGRSPIDGLTMKADKSLPAEGEGLVSNRITLFKTEQAFQRSHHLKNSLSRCFLPINCVSGLSIALCSGFWDLRIRTLLTFCRFGC